VVMEHRRLQTLDVKEAMAEVNRIARDLDHGPVG
jgi:hypothetical protein